MPEASDIAIEEPGRIREPLRGGAEEGTPRREFAPGVAKLILGLYDRSNGPKQFTTAADALKIILSDTGPLSLPATCVAPFRLCKHPTAPGAAALPKTD